MLKITYENNFVFYYITSHNVHLSRQQYDICYNSQTDCGLFYMAIFFIRKWNNNLKYMQFKSM